MYFTREDKRPDQTHLINCMVRLGGFESSPFAWTSVAWRIWCLELEDGEIKNMKDINYWAREASLSRLDDA